MFLVSGNDLFSLWHLLEIWAWTVLACIHVIARARSAKDPRDPKFAHWPSWGSNLEPVLVDCLPPFDVVNDLVAFINRKLCVINQSEHWSIKIGTISINSFYPCMVVLMVVILTLCHCVLLFQKKLKCALVSLNDSMEMTHVKKDKLTHCGIVTSYGDRDLGQHWLR